MRRGSDPCNKRWNGGRLSSRLLKAQSGLFTIFQLHAEFLPKSLEIFPGYEIFACRKLEEQLKETQVAKDELVAQQQELHEMMIRLDKDCSILIQSYLKSKAVWLAWGLPVR